MKKRRLDERLVADGLFPTRTKAQAAILAGEVFVEGKAVLKAGAPVSSDSRVEFKSSRPSYVSRGGLKLESALAALGVDVAGRVCLDIGASTGGFTDCLLRRGASFVHAVDVGRAQIDLKIKSDPRVLSREGLHAARIEPGMFSPEPDLATIDVSFISLTKVLPAVARSLRRPFEILALVKPQFEVGPKLAPKGVVRSPEARLLAVEKVRGVLDGLSLKEAALFECPVRGPKGNVEYFLHLRNNSETEAG